MTLVPPEAIGVDFRRLRSSIGIRKRSFPNSGSVRSMARPLFDEQTVLDVLPATSLHVDIAAKSVSSVQRRDSRSVASPAGRSAARASCARSTLDRYLDDGLDVATGRPADSGETTVDGIQRPGRRRPADMASNSRRPSRLLWRRACAVELAGEQHRQPDDCLRRHDERLVGRLTDALRSAQAEGADVTGPLDDAAAVPLHRDQRCAGRSPQGDRRRPGPSNPRHRPPSRHPMTRPNPPLSCLLTTFGNVRSLMGHRLASPRRRYLATPGDFERTTS